MTTTWRVLCRFHLRSCRLGVRLTDCMAMVAAPCLPSHLRQRDALQRTERLPSPPHPPATPSPTPTRACPTAASPRACPSPRCKRPPGHVPYTRPTPWDNLKGRPDYPGHRLHLHRLSTSRLPRLYICPISMPPYLISSCLVFPSCLVPFFLLYLTCLASRPFHSFGTFCSPYNPLYRL